MLSNRTAASGELATLPGPMILFLDYDGVLHPDAGARMMPDGSVVLDRGSPCMWADALIDVLAIHADLQIVLATNWVRVLGFERVRALLPAGVRERVIGSTWEIDGGYRYSEVRQGLPKPESLRRWLRHHPCEDWIILEDEPSGWTDQERAHLVLTKGATGISDPVVIEMLRAQLEGLGSGASRFGDAA